MTKKPKPPAHHANPPRPHNAAGAFAGTGRAHGNNKSPPHAPRTERA